MEAPDSTVWGRPWDNIGQPWYVHMRKVPHLLQNELASFTKYCFTIALPHCVTSILTSWFQTLYPAQISNVLANTRGLWEASSCHSWRWCPRTSHRYVSLIAILYQLRAITLYKIKCVRATKFFIFNPTILNDKRALWDGCTCCQRSLILGACQINLLRLPSGWSEF